MKYDMWKFPKSIRKSLTGKHGMAFKLSRVFVQNCRDRRVLERILVIIFKEVVTKTVRGQFSRFEIDCRSIFQEEFVGG